MTPKPVLYIEDNFHNRRLVRRILESQGYALIEAEDGERGLEMLREEGPPLVLLDIGLPTIDGWEVLSHIRADPELERTSVIAITASATREDRERFLNAGGDDYIPKPIEMSELIDKVHTYHGATHNRP